QGLVVSPSYGRHIGGSSRSSEIGMNKRADFRLPNSERIKAALERGPRGVWPTGKFASRAKIRLRLRHRRDIGRQHRQASVNVMAATRRWLAIIEVWSRNWRGRGRPRPPFR